MVQESEYELPCHWLLRRGLRERYINVSMLMAAQIRQYSREGSILDVGCGDGKGTNDLYDMLGEGYSIQGVDYSRKALLFAQAFSVKMRIEYVHVHAGNLYEALGDRRFNTVVLRDVLEHLEGDDLKSCLADTFKLLNSSGVVILTESQKVKNQSTC